MLKIRDDLIQAHVYDAKLFEELDGSYERVRGTWTWRTKGQPLYSKFLTLARSLASGTASPEIIAKRNNSCNTCPMMKKIDDKRYCDACGCGTWKLAELDSKLGWSWLECPLQKPGFSNEKSP